MTEEEETTAPLNTSALAAEVVAKWGPTFTKAVKEGDISEFKALFTDGLVEVVVQGAGGREACFTIADDNEEATLDWKTFFEMSTAQLKEKDYAKTESQCLGVLGPRAILEMGQFNSKGEIFKESISLLTLGQASGKIVAFESFTDPEGGVLAQLAEPQA